MPIPQLDTTKLPKLLEVLAGLNQQEFLLLQTNGTIEYATSNINSLFQQPGQNLTGNKLANLFGAKISQKLLKETNDRHDWLIIEHELPQHNDKPLNVQVSLLPYINNYGQTKGILLAITPLNIDNRQECFSSIGELTASIAHEIRNPLAGILTTAETLKEDFEAEDPHREYLERIINEINRVNLFLIKFLALARPQKPQLSLGSLSEIIDNVLYLEKGEIERQNIRVIRDYEPALPNILIDPHQMHQVFLNLILNAIQAMPGGGKLQISIKGNGKQGYKPDFIQVEITDNGTGISPQDMKKIFTPFFSTKPKGVGLGLSVSQKIFKEHKGSLKVESTLNKGTTFTLTLPTNHNK